MRAIWRVTVKGKDDWFATKKEAVAFCNGAGIDPEEKVERIDIGCYNDPKQTVALLYRLYPHAVSA